MRYKFVGEFSIYAVNYEPTEWIMTATLKEDNDMWFEAENEEQAFERLESYLCYTAKHACSIMFYGRPEPLLRMMYVPDLIKIECYKEDTI